MGLPGRLPALPLQCICLLLPALGLVVGHASAQSTPIVHENPTGQLTVSVTDHSVDDATGIKVMNHQGGDATITSSGLLDVDSAGQEAFGILVLNRNAGSSSHTTSVNVHDILSNSSAAPDNFEDIAALRIITTGGATVRSTGHIHTTGSFSYGVHVQQENTGSNTDPIDIQVTDITTEGPGSYGINADILNAGNRQIRVRVDGRIETSGWGSHGIAVGGNNAVVTIDINASGQVISTPPSGSWEEHGFTEEPANFAVSVRESTGGGNPNIASTLLTNRGVIRGDVDIEGCLAPRFDNYGTFNPYGTVMLVKEGCTPPDPSIGQANWTTGRLINHGTFVVGPGNQVSTVSMTGDLHQMPSGTLSFDVDWSALRSDRIEVTGMATLNGRLVVNRLSDPEQDVAEVTIVTATEGINGVDGLTVVDTPFFDYSVRKVTVGDANREELILSVIFDPTLVTGPGGPDQDKVDTGVHLALNQNQRNVLAELSNSRAVNDNLSEAYREVLILPDIEEVRFELDSYGNEIAGAAIQSTFLAARNLAGLLPDCSRRDSGIVSRRCVWASGHADRATRKRSWPQRGFRDSAHGLSSGFGILSDDGRLQARLGVGLSESRLAMDRFATARGHRFAAVAGITAGSGNFEFSLDTTAAVSRYRISRTVPDGDGQSDSTGNLSGRSLGVQAEAAWTGRMGKARVSPFAGVSYSRVRSRPYREQGADDLSLDVHRAGASLASANIGAEIRFDPFTASNLSLEPRIGLGVTRMIKDSITVESEFQGGAGSYLSTTSLLPETYDIGLGAGFRSTNDRFYGTASARLKLERDGRLHHAGLAGSIVIPF